MPPLLIFYHVLIFFILVLGLGLPWVMDLHLDRAEKLALGAGVGTFVIYLFAWIIYWTGLPPSAFSVLPVLAAGGVLLRWNRWAEWARDPDARGIVGRQLLFSGWCVAWLALVRSYSGGEWAGDWYEHYQRALFFLDRYPLGQKLISVYLLPARPPLGNLTDGALMALGRTDFASFQLVNTLFSSLIFLPAILLVRHFARGAGKSDAVLLLAMMGSPMIIQNATFAWTKLLAAFFILIAVVFYVRGWSEDSSQRRTLAAGAIAMAFLTHYSAGPYLVVLAFAQLWRSWRHREKQSPWPEFAVQGVLIGAVLATWFAWSIRSYGVHDTFSSNTTVTGSTQASIGEWLQIRWSNIFVTLVPHPLRPADYSFIAQTSRLGYLRDYWFNVYQTTLPGAFGLAGLLVAARTAGRPVSAPMTAAERGLWIWFIAAAGLLGIAGTANVDRWGVTHVCLISLIIVGVCWLAARLAEFPAWVRAAWLAALGIDLAVGIVLHFYIQNTDHLLNAWSPDLYHETLHPLSNVAAMNLRLKLNTHTEFLGNGPISPGLLGALLAACLLLALTQAVGKTKPGLPA